MEREETNQESTRNLTHENQLVAAFYEGANAMADHIGRWIPRTVIADLFAKSRTRDLVDGEEAVEVPKKQIHYDSNKDIWWVAGPDFERSKVKRVRK